MWCKQEQTTHTNRVRDSATLALAPHAQAVQRPAGVQTELTQPSECEVYHPQVDAARQVQQGQWVTGRQRQHQLSQPVQPSCTQLTQRTLRAKNVLWGFTQRGCGVLGGVLLKEVVVFWGEFYSERVCVILLEGVWYFALQVTDCARMGGREGGWRMKDG